MISKRFAFISCRRTLLDDCLDHVSSHMHGKVLDIGGKTIRRRGSFAPPIDEVDLWITVNPDPNAAANIIGRLPRLPFSDGSFNVIVCTEVLEYIENTNEALSEISRILTPNGSAYLSAPFIHRAHGDSEFDCLRFTGSYLECLCKKHFESYEIKPMGGIFPVVLDLLLPSISRYKFIRLLLNLLGSRISFYGSATYNITTGFFLICRK